MTWLGLGWLGSLVRMGWTTGLKIRLCLKIWLGLEVGLGRAGDLAFLQSWQILLGKLDN